MPPISRGFLNVRRRRISAAILLLLACFALPAFTQSGAAQSATITQAPSQAQTTPPAQSAPTSDAAQPKAAAAETYRAGGKQFALPPPSSDLVEGGPDNRIIMENFVPENNRLVASFATPEDLAALRAGSKKTLTKYAMVEVPRKGEFAEFSAGDFKDLADGAAQQIGVAMDSAVSEGEETFNRRMKSLELDNLTVKLDKPVQLGTLFSRSDAIGFGMILPVTVAGTTTRMIAGVIFLRVKNRVLFAYLYGSYKDESSAQWIRKASEEWVDAILKANQE
jgi:hypothetical protein